MTNVYNYVVAVTKRYPNKDYLKFSQPQLLAHDVRYDIEHNKLFDYSDEQMLSHIDCCLRDDEFRKAFKSFKRNFRSWLRRQQAN